MQLPVRNLPFEVPTYSMTGDVLSFQRCELQYRYYNRSSLPPSRPVQLWTGEFAHGVLEDAFLIWRDTNPRPSFPWPANVTQIPASGAAPIPPPTRVPHDIGEIGHNVEDRLRTAGKEARSRNARDAAYRRVEATINQLCPHLFPLIATVEERLIGTRPMPTVNSPAGQQPRGDRYEINGRVDVISSVSLTTHGQNPIVQMIQKHVAGITGNFDVIVDYKAARRPPAIPAPGAKNYWDHEAWQVQTYAWLRAQQPNSPPVKAGILIYTNELSPSETDLDALTEEIALGQTDVFPANGSADYYALNTYKSQPGQVPAFTPDYLLARAVRVVPVDHTAIAQALVSIDSVISEVESRALHENASGDIPAEWQPTGDASTCTACDFRRFCPNPSFARPSGSSVPLAPG